jgi:hypothetical protein
MAKLTSRTASRPRVASRSPQQSTSYGADAGSGDRFGHSPLDRCALTRDLREAYTEYARAFLTVGDRERCVGLVRSARSVARLLEEGIQIR